MVRPGRDRLAGRVGVDENYLGGLTERSGQSAEERTLIAIAAQPERAQIV